MARSLQLLTALATFVPLIASADLATVHLADGRSMTVDLVIVEQGQIQWKNPANPSEAMKSFLRSEIDYVDFPPTGMWKSAEDDFQSGNISAAIEGYQAVAASRDDHFYPMPGNFSSLALVRLLEIRRIQLDAKAVAAQFRKVREEWLNLPPDYRQLDPVIAAWIATSEEKWEEALGHLEKVKSSGPETFYLRGRATEALGRSEEAIQHYAGAYILNFGGFAEVTRRSLRRSIDLLAASDDKNRRAELQAQAKLYRDLFGKGTLWAEAPEWVVELAGAEIKTADADIDKTEMESPGGEKGTVVTQKEENIVLEPKENRTWLRFSELPKKIYFMNDPEAEIANQGGVTETTDGYEFDGTGGGLTLSKIDGRAKMWIAKGAFTPVMKDGVLFDLSAEKKKGFGFYLRDGKFIAVWKPAKGRGAEVDLGEIKVGEQHTFFFRVNQKGELRGRLNEEEPVDVGVDRRGLSLGANLSAVLGDTSGGEGDELLPFDGSVAFFALGAGEDSNELSEGEKAQFDGKEVRFRPPPDDTEVEQEGEEEPAAEPEPEKKPEEKPEE